MKETKFRGLSKKGFWVYGDLLTNHPNDGTAILENGCINHAVIPETVGQFTGMKDKKGIEIYEGDVVHIPNYGNTIIVFNPDVCAYQFAYEGLYKGTAIGDRVTGSLFSCDVKKYKIVGKIYDNTEFLK